MRIATTRCFLGIAVLATLTGCPESKDGEDGQNGADALQVLINTTTEPAGTNCAAGGFRAESGTDSNSDGVLDPSEVQSTTYVCNGIDGADGSDGADGLSALTRLTAEPAGANCPAGGHKFEAGLDADGDNLLDASEVQSTSYVCDGESGSDGLTALVDIASEPAGANCANGGKRIKSGMDADLDGALGADEVQNTTFICNGTDGADGSGGSAGSDGMDGLNALVALSAEPAGTNCDAGGYRIDSGLDADGDTVLDLDEVQSSRYVCNGEDGVSPSQAPVTDLEVIRAVEGEVTLDWTPTSDATSYNLYYATSAGIAAGIAAGNYAALPGGTRVSDVAPAHTVTGLTDGIAYYFVVTAVGEAGESTASSELVATPRATPAFPIGGLNDTGVDWCADSSTNYYENGTPEQKKMACSSMDSSLPDQDGMTGRDALARNGLLPRIGGGSAGFDFTRVCNSGDLAGSGSCPTVPEPGSAADEWGCTRDNVTGLTWELKTNDSSSLHHFEHAYTWYNSDSATNAGHAGWSTCTGSVCGGTEGFIQAVNTEGLCGLNDWRLPTRLELLSIVHMGRGSPMVDRDWFPYTFAGEYWTADTLASQPSQARAVNFHFESELVWGVGKSEGRRVRLVRSAP